MFHSVPCFYPWDNLAKNINEELIGQFDFYNVDVNFVYTLLGWITLFESLSFQFVIGLTEKDCLVYFFFLF